MDFSEIVSTRHSVRHFTEEPVDREIIDRIIAQAQTAPSSKNSHSTGFMVVEDRSTLEALSETRAHGSRLIAGAAAAVIVLGDPSKTDLWRENCSISATFLQLAAVNEGLGSCWVHVHGRARGFEDAPEADAELYVKDLLGIRDEFNVLCIVALGYEKTEE